MYKNVSSSRSSRNEEWEYGGNDRKRRHLMFRGWPVEMGEVQWMSFRRLIYVNNDLVISFNENILVIDNSCDQTIFNSRAFLLNLLQVYNLM